MTMTTDDLWQSNFTDHLDVAQATRAELFEPFERLLSLSIKAIQGGGKLLFFGNGGSAADAQHLATELSVRYVDDRPPIAAIALTTDGSALTAIGNDMGFEALFARQIEALGRAGDVAIGISTSGRSRNVSRGLEQARTQGLVAAAFSGRDGGDLVGLAQPLLIVPATVTARLQEMHITLGHVLCDGRDRGLGLVDRL